jgi:hypothetical protein
MDDTVTTAAALAERDAGRYIGYRPTALRLWRAEGRGPAYYRAGRTVRYRIADLDAWMLSRRVETRDSRRAPSPEAA